jgi:hypothetical protein
MDACQGTANVVVVVVVVVVVRVGEVSIFVALW